MLQRLLEHELSQQLEAEPYTPDGATATAPNPDTSRPASAPSNHSAPKIELAPSGRSEKYQRNEKALVLSLMELYRRQQPESQGGHRGVVPSEFQQEQRQQPHSDPESPYPQRGTPALSGCSSTGGRVALAQGRRSLPAGPSGSGASQSWAADRSSGRVDSVKLSPWRSQSEARNGSLPESGVVAAVGHCLRCRDQQSDPESPSLESGFGVARWQELPGPELAGGSSRIGGVHPGLIDLEASTE